MSLSLSIDGTDRHTDGHPAVTQALTAYNNRDSDLVVKFELGGLVICKKNSSGHNIITEKL